LAIARGNNNIEIWDVNEASQAREVKLAKVLRLPECQNGSRADEKLLRCLVWVASPIRVTDSTGIRVVQCERLFSGGLDGSIIEWNLYTAAIAQEIKGVGGAIWDMKVNSKGDSLAVACDDGSLRGFAVSVDDRTVPATELRTFRFDVPRLSWVLHCQSQRLTSVAWFPKETLPSPISSTAVDMDHDSEEESDSEEEREKDEDTYEQVVTGGADGCIKIHRIRLRKVEHSGRWHHAAETLPITARVVAYTHNPENAKKPKKDESAVVWGVEVLHTGQVVSVDSFGQLCVWCAKTGTLQKCFPQSNYDMLALAVDRNRKKIYTAGMDGIVHLFEHVDTAGEEENVDSAWVHVTKQQTHTHDILTLGLSSDGCTLYSGGTDCIVRVYNTHNTLYLTTGTGKPFSVVREISPFPIQQKVGGVAWIDPSTPILFHMLPDFMEIWKLGRATTDIVGSSFVPHAVGHTNAELIAKIKNKGKSPHNICFAYSRNGRRLFIARGCTVTAYLIEHSDPIRIVSEKLFTTKDPLQNLFYHSTEDDDESDDLAGSLVCVYSYYVTLWDLQTREADRQFTLPLRDLKQTTVSLVCMSEDASKLAFADTSGQIIVYNVSNGGVLWTPPAPAFPPTAMAMHEGSLLVVTSANTIHLYDVLRKVESEWTKEYGSDFPLLRNRKQSVIGTIFHPDRPLAAFWSNDFMGIINFDKTPSQETGNTSTKRKRSDEPNESEVSEFEVERDPAIRIITKYRPIIVFDWVTRREGNMLECVVGECPWVSVLKNMEPPVYRHKYRT